MLPRFRDVYGNPSMLRLKEIGPAVVSSDLRRVFVRRQRESNLKARRNSLRTRHRNEQGMKVGTVALLGIAPVEHVASPPTRARLVVTHGCEHVIVDGVCLVERRNFTFGNLHG